MEFKGHKNIIPVVKALSNIMNTLLEEDSPSNYQMKEFKD